ncbi:isocitrate dehydrogenase 2 [Candidatus Photodesmus blepharus]|uniref:Isocitrate dehydrogenase [NADP] n=1 Tax=Candidatus Photodesmus blepharonis TaxID=1179155 RepID=A0A084CMN5_9GAMM|nr:NADP-dependent isocitrate dehydrogenase [Candidatus Photodesmus blepharus]KEY91064.1 isocitrate dehydrogenase 2 [Candidatus Photodesmus blepharus]
MFTEKPTIIYTITDEAPALATYSLLPIIQSFTASAVHIDTYDISLAARIIANFPEYLKEGQQIDDALEKLGNLAKTASANIIKLPNISASIPQLKAAIKELQMKGYNLPNYPEKPTDFRSETVKATYDRIKGSAVNPVLRNGNSDRRIPISVKNHARKHPYLMGAWEHDSKSHVSSMLEKDFFGSEKSLTLNRTTQVQIEFATNDGSSRVLKNRFILQDKEIIDVSVMSKSALIDFFEREIADAKDKNVLLSLHMKATMMKVSDPIIFGHAVRAYYKDVFAKYDDVFKRLGVDASNGLSDVYEKIVLLPQAQKEEIELAIDNVYKTQPALAMVDVNLGITNFHVPSDVIIDSSMPTMLRSSGKMWGPDGQRKDTKAMIPDRSYASIYQTIIDFCKENGSFDPSKMGSISNVGLMAEQAEEYGSHDKTFILDDEGTVRVVDISGEVLFEQNVEKGDIFRMCQAKDTAIQDWIELAITRARITNLPAVFWLDKNRAHDVELIKKIKIYLSDYDTSNLNIKILSPSEACQFSLVRMRNGLDTISVTGNVLRDYLTDLFPILELGTSAKMLSVVRLMNGGGLFETGAGGSAPRHVKQVETENHLRWDSLGEFLALSASLEHVSLSSDNAKAGILACALDKAIGKYLDNDRFPSYKVGELDTRGSHYYLALYWAEALVEQVIDSELAIEFIPVAKALIENEGTIVSELRNVQGIEGDLGGYYLFDKKKTVALMRPSSALNKVIDELQRLNQRT